MRVGFLFNHFFPHQVPHAAPYAFELSRRQTDIEVIIACSSAQEMQLVEQIATLYPGHRCRFKRIRMPWYYRPFDWIISRWSFTRKRMTLRNNLDFFRNLDALVAPERHCFLLRSKWNMDGLTLIEANQRRVRNTSTD